MENKIIPKIEDHPNYGKDLMAIQREMSVPLGSRFRMVKATLRMLNEIRKEIGLFGLISLLKNVKHQTLEALKEHDFSSVRERSISEIDLKEIVERMILAQGMVREIGLEKAKEIRIDFSKSVAKDYLGCIFPTPKYLEKCTGGFFSNWKKFLKEYVSKSGQRGIQSGFVTETTQGIIKQNMDYCAFTEIAEILGDRELCYWTTCISDDFFFPDYMAKGNCGYTRKTTLATGGSVCDFCYFKNKDKQEYL